MSNTIILANKTYDIPELDFNAVCELSERGVDILDSKSFTKNPIIAARNITAWMTKTSVIDAGNIIQEHVIDGGDIADIFNAFNEAIEASGFIHSLQARGVKKPQDRKRKAVQ